MWSEWVKESQEAAVFMNGCEPRMVEAFAAMQRILQAVPGLKDSVPHLAPDHFLLCFCTEKCLDCHPLIPLLQMVTESNPGTRLGILPHRGNGEFLGSLAGDPTLSTLPSVILLSGERELENALFGRPNGMDVVTWRTGKGWKALFRWLQE